MWKQNQNICTLTPHEDNGFKKKIKKKNSPNWTDRLFSSNSERLI